MPALIEPDSCPQCRQAFQLGYAQRRQARLPLPAKAALAVGIAATVVLVPLFLVLVWQLVHEATAGTDLLRREKGMIYVLAYLLSLPAALLPWWAGWRYAFSRPRRLAVTCPACGWAGTCSVTEGVVLGRRLVRE